MSAVSPEVQQQGDQEALLSSGVSHDGDEVVERRESENTAGGNDTSGAGTEQARRSRWPWRRSKREGEQEKGERREGRGEVAEEGNVKQSEGMFTYDWDNGERIIWKASKRSRAEMVSQS